MCAVGFHQWLHEYCTLKHQLSLACRHNTYFWPPHRAAPRWPNDISSAVDNAIFKNRPQNIECSFGWVARCAVLLKPNVANILLFNFDLICEQKFIKHGPITIAFDFNGLSLLIFEKKMAQLWLWTKPNQMLPISSSSIFVN